MRLPSLAVIVHSFVLFPFIRLIYAPVSLSYAPIPFFPFMPMFSFFIYAFPLVTHALDPVSAIGDVIGDAFITIMPISLIFLLFLLFSFVFP